MQTQETVELPPNPVSLIESMRYIGYKIETALADVIDNSISAKAINISVQYRWNNGNPWIAIVDNGYGMSKEKLLEAMRFGGTCSTQERDPSDLGRFGLGLKTASLSQCRRLTVISKQNASVNACIWDIDELIRASVPKWNVIIPMLESLEEDSTVCNLLKRLDNISSGTIVIWQNLDKLSHDRKMGNEEDHFSNTMAMVANHIGSVFHRYFVMENGSKVVHIDFNGTEVDKVDPFGKAVPARQDLPGEKLCIDGQNIAVQPFILPHYSKVSKQEYEDLGGEEGYLQNQGFYVYRNRRLIIKANWFRLTPKTELTKLIRIKIDVPNTLDYLWQLDVKKSQVLPPQVILQRLKELIPTWIERGKQPYKKRGTKEISGIVHIWQREFKNNQVSYVLNENHPLVQMLIANEQGEIDKKKLSCLRIISDAFPKESFHVDVNSDDNIIVPVAKKEDIEEALRKLISIYHSFGMKEDVIKDNFSKNEMPISQAEIDKLIQEELHG